jgi:hypothetical protein
MNNDPVKKSGFPKWPFILLIVLVVIVVSVFASFGFHYSEGNRAGVLIKFSLKGYVFKTYEGELNLGGMGSIPGTAMQNQMWDFSVRDQATADTLMHYEGRRVSLHYFEVVKNLPWQGETKYFVDGVQIVKE